MWISYTPLNLQDQGWLRINTDLAAQAETLVQLVGEGLYPLLTINPSELDMGGLIPVKPLRMVLPFATRVLPL